MPRTVSVVSAKKSETMNKIQDEQRSVGVGSVRNHEQNTARGKQRSIGVDSVRKTMNKNN